jgi:hypothetical protein
MIRLCLIFLIVAAATLLTSGCASDTPTTSDTGHVSTIPWNRPESWEGQGALGGMLNSH